MDSPLNVAHRHQRKAEYFLRRENYDAAINHHKKAQEFLRKALSETSSIGRLSSIGQLSIEQQIDHHSHKQLIIKHWQKQRERHHQKNLTIKQEKENVSLLKGGKNEKSATEEDVEENIRTMIQNDSLLELTFSELLLQACNETSSSNAQESIQLQVDYHSRQQVMIKHRQNEAERRRQQILEIKQKKESETESLPKTSETSVTKELRMQAMKAMVKHDSLLEGIFTGTLFSSDNCSANDIMSHSVGNMVKTGVKSPKDDAVRLEELRINNDELKRTLFVLISEVEKYHAENKQLRKSLEELQKIHASCPPPTKARPLDVAQNSSSGFFSLPTDKRNISGICDLPALAPIEMAKSNF